MESTFDVEKLRASAKEYIWPTFGKDPSFFDGPGSIVVSAEGPYVTDVEGNRYIDSGACAAAATLGYNHPHVVDAMEKQLSAIVQNPSGWPASIPQIQLAEKIASVSPGDLKYTLFSNNGTDANETAIKVARAYWRLKGQPTKYKVIGRDRAYHGMSLTTLAAGGNTLRRKQNEPLPAGFSHISPPYCYRCKYPSDHPDCSERYTEELRYAIEREDPSTVAAYLSEQTISGGGILPPPPGYMKRIRDICDEYDILMISDEVVTGFGRTGYWFESEKHEVVPDMIAMAKGITGGHSPLAGTHVRAEVAQAFFGDWDNFLQHGYTYGGMAVSCAAGVAAMEFVEETGLMAEVPRRGAILEEGLRRIQEGSSIVGDVRGHGMLYGVELVKDLDTKEVWDDHKREEVARTLVATGKQHGVMFMPMTWLGTLVLMITPPLNIGESETGSILDALETSIKEVERVHM
jgi:adenosylmethionine-8-amino-7-oxononanoate aminotransferase